MSVTNSRKRKTATMTTLSLEHEEAKREAEIAKLPKVIVSHEGFRKMAQAAGWRSDVIDRLLSGPIPDRFFQVGWDKNACAVKIKAENEK